MIKKLLDKWVEETQFISNPSLLLNEDYQEAKRLKGDELIVYLIPLLDIAPWNAFAALKDLIKPFPFKVPKEKQGDVSYCIKQWKLWYKKRVGTPLQR